MDSFLEMRQASVLQKALLNNPLALPAPEALEIATLGGARAMGQEAEIGSLEVGKKADLIALNLEMPHTLPAVGRDVVGRIVYEATRENVTDSMVDGRFLYRAGKFLTLDAGAVLRDAERECLGCICRAGLEFGTALKMPFSVRSFPAGRSLHREWFPTMQPLPRSGSALPFLPAHAPCRRAGRRECR